MINHPNLSKKNGKEEIPVVVTTEHRGVFFGYTVAFPSTEQHEGK